MRKLFPLVLICSPVMQAISIACTRVCFVAALLLLFVLQSSAAARYARVSGNWNSTSIWASTPTGATGQSVPGNGDDVTINASISVTVDVAALARSLTVNGTLDFSGNFSLTIRNAGDVTVNTGGALIFSSNGQILGGAGNANGVLLTINSGASLTTANTLGFTTGPGTAALTGSLAIRSGNRGGPIYDANVNYTFNGVAAQVTGNAVIAANNITISNVAAAGVVSATSSITASGVVTINPSAQLALEATTLTLSGGGTPLVNNGTLIPGTSTVTYSGALAQNVEGTTYNNLTFSGAGTKTIVTGDIASVAGNWTTGTAAISLAGTAGITVAGNITGSAPITMGSGTLTAGGATTNAFANTGVFTPGTGTVNYNLSGAQTVRQTTYNNLTLSGTGTNDKTTTSITVNGILSMEGTATASAVPVYGVGATLRYNRTADQATGAEWPAAFTAGRLTGGVVVENTGDITLATANKVLGAGMPLTVQSNAVLDMSTFSLTLNNNFINNGGTLTGTTGGVVITGAAGQSIGAFTTTGTISSTKSGGTAILTGPVSGGGLTINNTGSGILNLGTGLTHTIGNFTRTAGTLEGGSSVLNISGTITNTAGTFTANTSTINFTGAGSQTVPALNYYSLGCSGAGTKTLSTAGSIGIAGIFTPAAGTYITTNSTVDFNGTGAQTIPALNYYSLSFSGAGTKTLTTAGSIGIAGIFTPAVGTYVITNSTVDFNGTLDQTIPAFTFHNLVVSNAGIKKILASITVACQTIDIADNASVEINADGGGRLDVMQ
jgi:hypothetical protein